MRSNTVLKHMFDCAILKKYRKDIILCGIVLLAALIIWLFYIFVFTGKSANLKAQITIDGELIGEYPLSLDNTFSVTTKDGFNGIVIEKGSVRVATADCRDKICVHRGSISRSGESIICLPHKLVIVIIGDTAGEGYDAFVD